MELGKSGLIVCWRIIYLHVFKKFIMENSFQYPREIRYHRYLPIIVYISSCTQVIILFQLEKILLNGAHTPDCSFCLLPETLLHVVSCSNTWLEQGRFAWRHDSILNFLAIIFQSVCESTIYVDVLGFLNPSAITGYNLRSYDFLVLPNI